jgi:hypothetical protein
VLEVDLVHDSGSRRDHSELVKGALAPAQELVALPVSLILQVDIALEGVRTAGHVRDHRVVDDQFCRRQRIHHLRVAAQGRDCLAHRGQIDHAGHPGEILHDHPSRGELDLCGRCGLGVPAGERFDVLGRDMRTSSVRFESQQVLQQHLQAVGQSAPLRAEPLVQLGQPEHLVAGIPDGQRAAGAEAVGAGCCVGHGLLLSEGQAGALNRDSTSAHPPV